MARTVPDPVTRSSAHFKRWLALLRESASHLLCGRAIGRKSDATGLEQFTGIYIDLTKQSK
jgi:hypothetical protein